MEPDKEPIAEGRKSTIIKDRMLAALGGGIMGLVLGTVLVLLLAPSRWESFVEVPVLFASIFGLLSFLGGPKLLKVLMQLPWS